MSLRFFKARTLIFTEAGLAGDVPQFAGLEGIRHALLFRLGGDDLPLDLHEAGNGEDTGALGAEGSS